MAADADESEPSPGERFADLTLVQETLRRAVREALLQHKRAGNPIAVWRDGKVVWIAPEDIAV